MKVLHTADLHLGKTLHEMPLLEIQEKMLDDMYRILCSTDYAALFIAGDIYDRAVPAAEAVSLFSRFLAKVRSGCPETAVFIIPGNHDSAQRLAFAHEILQNQHIYIAQNTAELTAPFIITQGTEKIEVFLLPFLSFGSFTEELRREQQGGDSQAAMAATAAELLKKAVNPDIPSVLLAHLFTVGGQSSASERTFIGTAEYINPALFSFFDYTALGHLHRCQRVTDRMYYSGSPLAYAFDEADDSKCVLSVDIDCTAAGFPVQVERIPIVSARPLKRLEGAFEAFFSGSTFDEWSSCFLEITLTDAEVISNPMQLLRQKFPYVLSIRQKSFMERHSTGEDERLNVQEYTAEDTQTLTENFNRFETIINGESSPVKQELFQLLCRETAYET
ncbi:MAG: exonuclease SbcCD subunit D [Treponema sp.]